ncbi:MAG: hypothetical protein IKO41_08970 [Lachnospiraceae bacterium]|nr:hypothetical protein [Lachnospiraceae bacterium]
MAMKRQEEALADELTKMAEDRYAREGKKCDKHFLDRMWYDLLGTIQREGAEAARQRALTAKLIP